MIANALSGDAASPEDLTLNALAVAGFNTATRDSIALFNDGSIAAALVEASGALVFCNVGFATLGGVSVLDRDLVARVARGDRPILTQIAVPAAGAEPDLAIFAYARLSDAKAWSLPLELFEAAAGRTDLVVVVTILTGSAMKPLEQACRAYGLTGLQTRVTLETIRSGSIRDAAARLEISYQTAREAMAEAMRRVGASRLPGLVSRLTALAFGALPNADNADILGDVWGLTRRQSAVAGLVADGLPRASVAKVLGLGEAVVKKELDQIYPLLGVSSGAALARKLAEANALRWLTEATGNEFAFADISEPLQFFHRPDGSRIAVSDHGPASGKPVLVVHSSMTSRIASRALVRALQAEGYRPIAIDRPGFGMTDEAAGMKAGAHDPYATAAADAVLTLDRMKLRQIDIVARGGAQFVLGLHAADPGRPGRVVLVNPDPHTENSGLRVGPMGIMKEIFYRHPSMIRLAISVMARNATYTGALEFMPRTMRGSAPDEIAAVDPLIVRDYFRSVRMFSTGRFNGYVNEQVEFSHGTKPPSRPGTANWEVLMGAHDILHDPAHTLAYWRDVLPDARFTVVEDAGRLMALSHPQHVVAALMRRA